MNNHYHSFWPFCTSSVLAASLIPRLIPPAGEADLLEEASYWEMCAWDQRGLAHPPGVSENNLTLLGVGDTSPHIPNNHTKERDGRR